MDHVSILKRVPWFADLEASELALLANRSDSRHYPEGSIVFHEGDRGDHLLVIVKGRLRVTLIDIDGDETILRELGPHDYLGELSLLDGLPRSASAVALETTELLRISRDPFLALIAKRPSIALKVMSRIVADLRRATEQIRTMSMSDLRGQVVRCHIQIALEKGLTVGPRIEIRPQPPRLEVARRIGCRPESVSRALKELSTGGFMTKVKGGVVVERRAITIYWPSVADTSDLR
jgi:CRP/FNR family transcriptional regulator, cyclic AMP receptor protein